MAKKASKRAGRPPLPDKERLGSPVGVRYTVEQQQFVEEAAVAAGETLAAFVRDASLDRARQVLGRDA